MSLQNALIIGIAVSVNVAIPHRLPAQSDAGVIARPVSLVNPGTLITERSPEGWSHLIVKGSSQVTEGDLEDVPAAHLQLAERFGTVLLANVQQGPAGTYELDDVGVGCTVRIRREDVVVSPDSQKRLGAKLNLRERITLDGYFRHQQSGKVFLLDDVAIVDTPAAVRHTGHNQFLTIRYALALDRGSGRLDSFVWLLLPNNTGEADVGSTVRRLPPNKLHRSHLYADKSEYTLGIPSDRAFATVDIPAGEVLTDGDNRLLGAAKFSASSMQQLKTDLLSRVPVSN